MTDLTLNLSNQGLLLLKEQISDNIINIILDNNKLENINFLENNKQIFNKISIVL